MKTKNTHIFWTLLLTIFIAALACRLLTQQQPAFADIEPITQRKQTFIQYLRPYIERSNLQILKKRSMLLELKQHYTDRGEISYADLKHIKEYCIDTKLDCPVSDIIGSIDKLLVQTDIVPPSLALAQAAMETGWGTSRFSAEGNNFFGQWCYEKGCGLVPYRRDSGAKHEVRTFNNPQGSVDAYMDNLNTVKSYRKLRTIRTEKRDQNLIFTGHELAEGLTGYSATGQQYVKNIRKIIKSNNLEQYDADFWNRYPVNKH